jgi:signal peptidase II
MAVLVFAALVTIGCDQATKAVSISELATGPDRSFLADVIRLGYVENTGGFLSLGAGLRPAVRTSVFTVATGFGLVALLVMAIRRRTHGWAAVGLVLLVSGGASNWFDRLIRGSVVDFLHVGLGPVRTGVFNVADVAIMAGAMMFVLGGIRPPRARTSPDAEPRAPRL